MRGKMNKMDNRLENRGINKIVELNKIGQDTLLPTAVAYKILKQIIAIKSDTQC